jgi:hypothetical protein
MDGVDIIAKNPDDFVGVTPSQHVGGVDDSFNLMFRGDVENPILHRRQKSRSQ